MTTGKMKAIAATALMVVSLLAASGAQATLFYRLNDQAVYDDVAKLTWLQDANYAQTSGYDHANANGQMNWTAAMDWAAQLSIGGVTGWRLPVGPMSGKEYYQKDSEMGNMFYNVLGGEASYSIGDKHSTNYDFFQNIQSKVYWSGVEFAPKAAWLFNFRLGNQYYSFKVLTLFAWAVHDGDVGAVPAPGTLALLVAGLFGWAGVKRSRRA